VLKVASKRLRQWLWCASRLFDVYRPKGAAGLQAGEKSLALRLTLNSETATLTDEQIEAAVQAVTATGTATDLGARLTRLMLVATPRMTRRPSWNLLSKAWRRLP
jgi:phenylalanyl-tRNA synthetase beta subunit